MTAPTPLALKLPLLYSWRDLRRCDAVGQMALDEALFRLASERGIALARFYAWDAPAVTVGYFDALKHETDVPGAVRRLTGGGRVEHGEDLTFLLAAPPGAALASAPGPERYRFLHEALAAALAEAGAPAALHPPREKFSSAGPCFAHPVPWDLVQPGDGIKIGGGAQRRSRGALIHQGSLRLPETLRHPESPWIDRFLDRLAESHQPVCEEWREEALRLAAVLASERYGSASWNRPRG